MFCDFLVSKLFCRFSQLDFIPSIFCLEAAPCSNYTARIPDGIIISNSSGSRLRLRKEEGLQELQLSSEGTQLKTGYKLST